MKKYARFLLVFLCLFLTACSDKDRHFSGEVSDLQAEDGNIVSFVVTDETGKRTGILVPEDTAFTSRVDQEAKAEKELLLSGQRGTSVSVECKGSRTSLTTDSGEKLPAYTAWFIAVSGYLTPNAAALRDGTPLDVFHWTDGVTYRLTDGTDLLYVRDTIGPEHVYISSRDGYDDLNEAAQRKISAYYADRGLLYSVEDELESACANIPARVDGQPTPCLGQDVSPSASSERVIYFLTCLTLPVYGDRTANATEVLLCDAFDRETGEHIDGWDLFACPPEEAVQELLDLARITEQPLRSEVEAAFQPEYMRLYSGGLEVFLPKGALPSEGTSWGFGMDYNDGLRAVFQEWALPN